MKRIFAIICLLLVAALGSYTVYHTQTVKVTEDITLVTIDALPDHVIVVRTGPDPVVHMTRVRPAVVVTAVAKPTNIVPRPPGSVPPKPAAAKPVAKWTLLYSCEEVKWWNSKFSKEELETMRVVAHEPKPTADQLRQIDACIHDKL